MKGIDKNQVRRSFAAASATYDQAAQLQRQVGETLLASIPATRLQGITVDLGCGTGFFGECLLDHNLCAAGNLIAVDIALPMLNAARAKLGPLPAYICADAERLPFADHSISQLYSNLALQWCVLENACIEFKRVLSMGGHMRFSTFGSATLHELKSAWRAVDQHRHVNDFYDETQINAFLKQAGFKDIRLQTRVYQRDYPSVLALMHELKSLGAHTVTSRQAQLTSRTQLQRMITAYESHRLDSGGIPATFEVIFATAKG